MGGGAQGQKGRGGEPNLTHFPGDSAERRLEVRSSEEEVKIGVNRRLIVVGE